jgi:hypothetical protein
MEKYNYRQAVMDDIRNYISENSIQVTNQNREEVEGFLYDTLFVEDSVTGNASGSYTFNTWKAEEYLCHNLDLLAEACVFMSGDPAIYRDCLESAEKADVTIRCYVLSECLSSVLDELEVEEEDEYRMDGDK